MRNYTDDLLKIEFIMFIFIEINPFFISIHVLLKRPQSLWAPTKASNGLFYIYTRKSLTYIPVVGLFLAFHYIYDGIFLALYYCYYYIVMIGHTVV